MFKMFQKYADFLLNNMQTSFMGEKELMLSEINHLRADVLRERARADLAIDQLLQLRSFKSVMPERNGIMTPEERKAASERIKAMELLRGELESVGDTGSDPDDIVSVDEIK